MHHKGHRDHHRRTFGKDRGAGHRQHRSGLEHALRGLVSATGATFGLGSILLLRFLRGRKERNLLPKGIANARAELQENARKAMAMKQAAPPPQKPESHTANEGPRSIPNPKQPPGGNFQAEGHYPVLERTRRAR